MNNDEPNRPMNAAQVAEYLGVAKSTVYQLPITYYAYGSRRVYDLKDVQEYKETCRRVVTKGPEPVLKLTASSTTGATELQSYFQKIGLRDSEGNRIRKIKSRR
jgi:hypothetical protein